MIAQNIAVQQVMRLAGQRGFDKIGKAGTDELVRALQTYCHSQEHAERTINRAIEADPRCPTFSELKTHAKESQVVERRRVNFECSECRGSGFCQVFLLVTWEHGGQKKERITREQYNGLVGRCAGPGSQACYEAAELCSCPHGLEQDRMNQMYLAHRKAERERKSQ